MSSSHEVATFGAGCFWCFDAVARRLSGVVSSVTGYAGGSGPTPTYWDVHSSPSLRRGGRKKGDWVEAVQVTFEPEEISFRALIDFMFKTQDPTIPNRDGANVGPEYHSTIYFHSADQEAIASKALAEWSTVLGRSVATSIVAFSSFYPAEEEHQNFFDSNPSHPYCNYVIVPKLNKVLDKL